MAARFYLPNIHIMPWKLCEHDGAREKEQNKRNKLGQGGEPGAILLVQYLITKELVEELACDDRGCILEERDRECSVPRSCWRACVSPWGVYEHDRWRRLLGIARDWGNQRL